MSKRKLNALKKKMEELQGTQSDVENQVKMLKAQALEKREQRYSLMKKDFTKNKEKVFQLDKEEKEIWDSIRSLNEFNEELDQEKEQQTKEIVLEAVQLRREMESKLKQEIQEVQNELLKKKFAYLVELEKTVKETRQKSVNELEEVNEFIIEYGNAKMLPRGEYQEKSVGIDTGYGRKNLPSHLVSNDDYSTLFGREDQQNFSYRLFKEFGENELDPNKAQKRYRELKK